MSRFEGIFDIVSTELHLLLLFFCRNRRVRVFFYRMFKMKGGGGGQWFLDNVNWWGQLKHTNLFHDVECSI